MEGVGFLSGALESDPHVLSFSSAGQWEVAREPLHMLSHSYTPINHKLGREHMTPEELQASVEEWRTNDVKGRVMGAGLGLAFGRAMARATGETVGLIPAAHGGTSLEQWSADKKDEGIHSLYGAMLDRIERAGGDVRGVLWYQGESDCSPELAPTYGARLEAWIAALRKELGRPDMPFYVVQLGRLIVPTDNYGPTEEELPHIQSWNEVRTALADLPKRVAHCAATTAIDLELSDVIHIDATGLIRLGERLARLALKTHPSPEVQSVRFAPVAGNDAVDSYLLECSGASDGWAVRHNMAGFSLHTRDGMPHKSLAVVDVSEVPGSPSTLRVLLSGRADEECLLAYGWGHAPICNAVTKSDMPLLAFAPRALKREA